MCRKRWCNDRRLILRRVNRSAPRNLIIRAGAVVLVLVLTAGCATYEPAPLDARDVAQRQKETRMDPDAVGAVLERIAPDYRWDRASWNELTLFAAALAASPEAARARSSLLAAQASARAASVAPGPSFALSAEYALNAPEHSPWLLGVLGDLPLEAGGRRRARLESAEIALRQARLDYGQSIWRIRMSLRRALLAWRDSGDALEPSQTLLARTQAQFDATLHRVEAGEVPRSDLERVRGDLAAAQDALSSARALRDRSVIDLAAAIGVAPDAVRTLRIEAAAPVGALPGAAPADAEQVALENRSEISRAVTDYDLAESGYRAAVAEQFPAVSIGAGYTWERGLKKLPAALTLALPSWDLNASAIRAAQAARDDAGAKLELAVATVLTEMRGAQSDYAAAQSAVALAEQEIVPAALRLADQADRELAVGWIDRADWAAAQAGLAKARIDLLAARRRIRSTFLALEDAMQTPLAGPETMVGAGWAEPAG